MRQRCLAHRLRSLAVTALEELWPEIKARVIVAYQAPFRAIARDLSTGMVTDCRTGMPAATACFMDDSEACIAHLCMPITHRRAIRTTNLLERMFVEERRRLKIIPNAFGEKTVLKLMFGAMIRAAEPSGSANSSVVRCAPAKRSSIENTMPRTASVRRPQPLHPTPDDRNKQDGRYHDLTGSRPHHFDDATRIPAITMGNNKTVNVKSLPISFAMSPPCL